MLDFLYTGEYTVQPPPEQQERATAAKGDKNEDPVARDPDWPLWEHMHVNAIADYYNIQPLAERSTVNIKDVIRNRGDPQTIMSAAYLAFNMTGDKTMQHAIADAVSGNLSAVLADERHTRTLAELVNDFGIAILQRKTDEQKAQKMMLEKLEKSLKASEAKCERMIKNFETCRLQLDWLSKCTNVGHCQATFTCVLDKTGQPWEPRYTVRCGSCARRYN